jgi:hypothetical protein
VGRGEADRSIIRPCLRVDFHEIVDLFRHRRDRLLDLLILQGTVGMLQTTHIERDPKRRGHPRSA